MEAGKNSIQRLGLTAGLATSVVLVAYFLLMKLLHLAHIAEFRYLNFFIFIGGIMYAYRHYKKANMNIDYLPGLGLGLITSAASILPFAMFLYVYFSVLDPDLLRTLRENSVIMHEYLTPSTAAGVVLMEGICTGVIASFSLMQYYKSGFGKTGQEILGQQG